MTMTEFSDSTQSKRALICLGSEQPEPAHLLYTGRLLKTLSFRPTLACFQSKNEPEHQCRQHIKQAAGYLGFDTYDQVILKDKPEQAIQRQLDRGKYKLLVLGASICAPGSQEQGLIQRLVEKAKASVLVVQNPPGQLRRILVCTGGHKSSELAVLAGLDLADASRSKLTILHIATAAPSMYAGLNAQDENLEQVLARQHPLSDHLREMAALAEKRGVDAKIELRHGVVVEEILRACDMNPCDLVIMGTRKPRSFLSRLALGRVSPQLITSSDRPILIVRQPIKL
jgi:nucleotide-binding universal stress UspA family protein